MTDTSLTLANKVTLIRIMGTPVFILIMIYYRMSLGRDAPI